MKYSLTRTSYGEQDHKPIYAIKSLRSLFDLSLKEAKDLVDAARVRPTSPIVFERNDVITDEHFRNICVSILPCGYKLNAITSSDLTNLRSSLEQNAKLAIDVNLIDLAIDLLKLRMVHFR